MAASAVKLVPASPAHVGRLANRMREIDAAECAARGHAPKQSLRLALRASVWSVTAMIDGDPHAMFGIAPVSVVADRGCPWFLGSDAVLAHGRDLLTLGPLVLGRMHASFARLENSVSVDNEKALRLLARWGFSFGDEAHEVGGMLFRKFWRESHV